MVKMRIQKTDNFIKSIDKRRYCCYDTDICGSFSALRSYGYKTLLPHYATRNRKEQ